MTGGVSIARIEAFAFRSPIEKPVATSFGVMRNRPATFVRVEDQDGTFGWGEIFANWPAAAAEHRVNLLAQDIAPLVFDRSFFRPGELFEVLTARTHIVALQSGEWGPFRQVIAGLDIALWDLFARKNGQTLRHFMTQDAADLVPAYASGIHIKDAPALMQKARDIGFDTFKVKVGFDRKDDLKRLNEVFETKLAAETIAADANQGWDRGAALDFITHTRSLPLLWLEEPIKADAAQADWAALAEVSPYPLAGGENLVGFVEFDKAINEAHLSVFQPDIIKWGGLTGCLSVGQSAIKAGLRYCPHFLGGGIGLQASANLLAAVGGDGLLEVDVNPNPLRDAFMQTETYVADNGWQCNEVPGIGVTALPEALAPYLTHRAEILS
ncbi:mandelate racemase/muconate lactonizing enzyme family protein [Roseobacter weihaiensis]|uniref:mandelate racemase/muconate lactonizing enzyme family protein n=1 Tax=Roseobacter weihaiensis TaxID=2763262 RepID=UPI001D0B58C4|nr:mandelate racemase/muconate lactonizing enzyme family protein [Roseobacter sp. H9]